ncbi:hypothetical protein Back2_09760 [Nocardioides baekrokdamisoli]|uniref:Glycosyl transferase family 1 domain-containing protein n=1 Tax=Nocardioides baekrokdamisoli TaxID=1804624 RepID=A0A3G9J161_9ACTN|nr:glycosyltransferase family 4 protein [Nocardioides baekrokdamisoli]BBH16689.1 hypothetical protein Back2_09760 [Nocardioides baekrokdamisoli]
MPSRPTIHFIWEFGIPLPAGTGGSENYTIGHVRELNRRGVRAEIVTVGVVGPDGRDEFPGVPFRALDTVAEVGRLDGIVVFVTEFPSVATRRRAFQMLHVPPPIHVADRVRVAARMRDRTLIATSQFAAHMWASFLSVDETEVRVVYPFAEPCFGEVERSEAGADVVRVLFAGRLSPEKGVFTLLSMLHLDMASPGVAMSITATTAGSDKPHGAVIRRLLAAHPDIRLVEARKTPEAMAALMAQHDVVVMPSNGQYWHETFGIVSIEAQHAGCQVVASDDGGLPETDCGAITFVVPDDAAALAVGINRALARGPQSRADRAGAARRFTVAQSATDLLAVLDRIPASTPSLAVVELDELVSGTLRTPQSAVATALSTAVHLSGAGA